MTRMRARRVATPRADRGARRSPARSASAAPPASRTPPARRARARPAADASFVAFVLDQLESIPEVRSRAMFGGHGIYSAVTFFAIVHGGRLYFRVDDASRASFEARAMKPFSPFGTAMRGYWEVPVDVIEDAAQLARWAHRAVSAAAARR